MVAVDRLADHTAIKLRAVDKKELTCADCWEITPCRGAARAKVAVGSKTTERGGKQVQPEWANWEESGRG